MRLHIKRTTWPLETEPLGQSLIPTLVSLEANASEPGATLVNLVLPYREPNRCREVLVKRHGDELDVVEDTVQSPVGLDEE
jgi:hypothetical protein